MAIMVIRRWLWLAVLVPCGVAWPQGGPALVADINETVIDIPVIVNGQPTGTRMVGTLFKPSGDGPFPFAIISHGRAGTPVERAQVQRWRYVEQSRWLVRKGYVVIVPTRRGYGGTGGTDVEASYNCTNPWYKEALAAGVESVLSAIEFAKAQTFVDPRRFILVGQSVGGFVTVGVTAAAPAGLLAAVNFAGGHGGDPQHHPAVPCAPEKLLEVYSEAGKTGQIPMLWIYTENDQYFGPDYSLAWHKGYTEAGGRAELQLLPPFQNDGHRLFVNGISVWRPVVEAFFAKIGL
jgi:dienelactone hydrolase